MILRLSSKLLLLALLAVSMMACVPVMQDFGMDQDVIDNMNQEKALKFLQSLVGGVSLATSPYCIFQADGVGRWIPFNKQILPDKYPYQALRVKPVEFGNIILFVQGNGYCLINGTSNARQQGKDLNRFMGKIMMTLMRLGVTPVNYNLSGLRPPGATATPKN